MSQVVLVATVLSFLTAHSTTLTKKVLMWRNKTSEKEISLKNERQTLKQEQSQYNMIDDFAKYMKIQRKIIKIEEELKTEQKNKNGVIQSTAYAYGFQIVCSITLLILTIYYRSTPVFKLDDKIDLTPFGRMITYPNEHNEVSLHFWIMSCNIVARLIKF